MGRRTTPPPSAAVIQFPRAPRLDVRDRLLNNQSAPTVPRPTELDVAIDVRARELAEEAFELCREHLRRRVAYTCEYGYPKRVIDMEHARRVIDEGDLGDALARMHRKRLVDIAMTACSASKVAAQFEELANEIRSLTASPGER
jgi:hypothetical protein